MVINLIKSTKKKKAMKICYHLKSKSTYAVYWVNRNIIFYNLDFDETRCGFIHLFEEY